MSTLDEKQGLSRRQLLKWGTAVGAGLVVTSKFKSRSFGQVLTDCPPPNLLTTPLTRFKDELPIPPWFGLNIFKRPFDKHFKPQHFKINTSNIMHKFHADLPPMPAWGFNNTTPGPTINAFRNVPTQVTFWNNLTGYVVCPDMRIHGAIPIPYLTIHNHGLLDRPEDDGFPEDRFPPAHAAVPNQNNYYTYNYPNIQQAANYWYHDHSLGTTRINIYSGLFAFYLLRDECELSYGIPIGPPYEVPLVINDKEFRADKEGLWFPYPWEPEFCGRFTTVNQKVWPKQYVDRGIYRYRILNGSDDRFYRLHFLKNGQELGPESGVVWQIGTDGGFLPQPIPLPVKLGGPQIPTDTGLLLGPAERADVLIDFSKLNPGDEIVVTNDAPCPFPFGPPPAEQFRNPIYSTVMKFIVTNRAGKFKKIPQSFYPQPEFDEPYYTRNVALNEVPWECDPLLMQPRLNNLLWEFPPTEVVRSGQVEQWNIINTTGDTHPIHLHQTQFQILYRQKFNQAAFMTAWNPNMGPSVMMCDRTLENQCTYPSYPSGTAPTDGLCYPIDQGPLPPDITPYLEGDPVPPDPNEIGLKDTVKSWPGFVNVIKVPFGPFEGRFVWHCHMLSHEDNEMMRPLMLIAKEVPADNPFADVGCQQQGDGGCDAPPKRRGNRFRFR